MQPPAPVGRLPADGIDGNSASSYFSQPGIVSPLENHRVRQIRCVRLDAACCWLDAIVHVPRSFAWFSCALSSCFAVTDAGDVAQWRSDTTSQLVIPL